MKQTNLKIQSAFSGNNGIEIETNKRKVTGKISERLETK